MACPQVSGVAALVVSYFGKQGFTADMLKDILIGGAKSGYVAAAGTPIGVKVDALGSFEYAISTYGDPHAGPSDADGIDVRAWPNPVTDVLTVQTGVLTDARVRLIAGSGRTVLDRTLTVGPGYPLTLDLSGIAPGRYTLIVSYGDKENKKTIIKK